ncbi:MAG: hypothetical protein QXS90_00690, partial [Candidatus Diapherotrites archaeon]
KKTKQHASKKKRKQKIKILRKNWGCKNDLKTTKKDEKALQNTKQDLVTKTKKTKTDLKEVLQIQ